MSDSMEDIYEELKLVGKDIAEWARAGDRYAQAVMRAYTLHYDAPGDPGAQALLQIAFDEYKKREEESSITDSEGFMWRINEDHTISCKKDGRWRSSGDDEIQLTDERQAIIHSLRHRVEQ